MNEHPYKLPFFRDLFYASRHKSDFKIRRANRDPVTILQLVPLPDRLAIKKRSVSAAAVLNGEQAPIHCDHAMSLADQLPLESNVAIISPSN